MDVSRYEYDCLDTIIDCEVITLTDSYFIWVGLQSSPAFTQLQLAMQRNGEVFDSTLINDLETPSNNTLAQRLGLVLCLCCQPNFVLVKRIGRPVYLSYNLPDNEMLQVMLERRLVETLVKSN